LGKQPHPPVPGREYRLHPVEPWIGFKVGPNPQASRSCPLSDFASIDSLDVMGIQFPFIDWHQPKKNAGGIDAFANPFQKSNRIWKVL